jgi:hypothetical protein
MGLLLDVREQSLPDFRIGTTTTSLRQLVPSSLSITIVHGQQKLSAHWWNVRKYEVMNAAGARGCVAGVF